MKDIALRSQLLWQLIENSQDGVVVAEKEGRDTVLIYVNPAFEKLTGYKADEILYQDCRFLQGDNTEQSSVKAIREAIENNQPIRTTLKNYRKDGSMFWNELSVTPYFDEQDQITYYIGIQKDVTEQETLKLKVEENQQKIEALQAEIAELKNT